jgi:hypothetical protein
MVRYDLPDLQGPVFLKGRMTPKQELPRIKEFPKFPPLERRTQRKLRLPSGKEWAFSRPKVLVLSHSGI